MTHAKTYLMIVAAFALAVTFLVPSSYAATIVINNLDGPGEGFNDPTAVAPVGGNPGVTLGQQRLNAFQFAANLWSQCLFSNVTITIDAQMNPQFCTAGSAVLGSAGATTVHRDFGGAPKPLTWYSQALANSLAGVDLAPGTSDVNATFNSSIDNNNNCLNGINWYYGLDASPTGNDIDFVTVVLHEIGHGLGFQTFQNAAGQWLAGFQDTYGCNMFHDGFIPPDYPSMTDAQRGQCNLGDPDLVWDGVCGIQEALATLVAGLNNGRPRLHGPNPYQGGSSLSHWSNALFPNQLMEPFYTGPDHTVDLDVQLLKDTGWVLDKTVATAFAAFDVTATGGGVEISSIFISDGDEVRVNVYRGAADNDRPSRRIGSVEFTGGLEFRYVDRDITPGETYTYRIGVRDSDGEFFSPVERVRVPVPEVALGQNAPNPFNPVTTISFVLPSTQEVTLSVYDAQGKLVRNLIGEVRSHGAHSVEWNGTDNSGLPVSSGIYFYRLSAGKFSQSKKMVLLK